MKKYLLVLPLFLFFFVLFPNKSFADYIPTFNASNITWDNTSNILKFNTDQDLSGVDWYGASILVAGDDPNFPGYGLWGAFGGSVVQCSSNQCIVLISTNQINSYTVPGIVNSTNFTNYQIQLYDYHVDTVAYSQDLNYSASPFYPYTLPESQTPTPTPTPTPTVTPMPSPPVTNFNASNITFDGSRLTFNTDQDLSGLPWYGIELFDDGTGDTNYQGAYIGGNGSGGISCSSTQCTAVGISFPGWAENSQGTTNWSIAMYTEDNNNYVYSSDMADYQSTEIYSYLFPTPTPAPVPPSVGSITITPNPVKINSSMTSIVSFTSADSADTASWNWGDGHTTTGTITENNGSGSVTNTHTYTALGSDTITLTLTNSLGSSSSQSVVAVVPTGGVENGNLSHTNYEGANFSSQNLTKVNGSNAEFENVNFSSATLTQSNFSNSNLTGSNFTSADLDKANLSNSNLTNANFTGANLTQANLSNTTLTGVTWSNTTCPDGTNSNNDSSTCVGHL